jgi:hypothetical protein
MRQRDGMRQVNWWLPVSLYAALKTYQHAMQLNSLNEAARLLLHDALDRWRARS